MVKLKFRHSHKRIYLLLSTTQNMYVTRMEEADMGDSPVIYLLVSAMSITPGTSVFQPISPLSSKIGQSSNCELQGQRACFQYI